MSPPSVVGVRAEWRCAVCEAKARTLGFVHAIDYDVSLRPPHGWTIQGDRTLCPQHSGPLVDIAS